MTQAMENNKKGVVYILPYKTEGDIKRAEIKMEKLYKRFNSVQVFPSGLSDVKIVAKN